MENSRVGNCFVDDRFVRANSQLDCRVEFYETTTIDRWNRPRPRLKIEVTFCKLRWSTYVGRVWRKSWFGRLFHMFLRTTPARSRRDEVVPATEEERRKDMKLSLARNCWHTEVLSSGINRRRVHRSALHLHFSPLALSLSRDPFFSPSTPRRWPDVVDRSRSRPIVRSLASLHFA